MINLYVYEKDNEQLGEIHEVRHCFPDGFELGEMIQLLVIHFGSTSFEQAEVFKFDPKSDVLTLRFTPRMVFEHINIPHHEDESYLVFKLDPKSIVKTTTPIPEQPSDPVLSLVELLAKQAALQAKMGYPTGHGEHGVKENMLALMVEATEVLNEINWKPWKKTLKEVDPTRLATELTDILQFWANAALAAGLTPQALTAALRAKWVENHRRVEEGY